MAGVLEYITAEIFEVAGNIAEKKKRKTLAPVHINLGIRSDEELSKLLGTMVISQGGMTPNI